VSFDLYAWKAPLVSEKEASKLLNRFYDDEEVDVFEPSDDVLRFYDDLLTRYPALGAVEDEGEERASWWMVTPERSDRVVGLNLSWSTPGEVLDDIVERARARDLVLYDPQGPSFHSPESILEEPGEGPGIVRSTLRGILIGGAILALGIFLPVPVLDWALIVVGAFMIVISLAGAVYWLRAERRKALP
jgi:hypothetical protein